MTAPDREVDWAPDGMGWAAHTAPIAEFKDREWVCVPEHGELTNVHVAHDHVPGERT